MNISLAGCGFLGVYLMGALDCLKQFSPHFIQKAQVFGVSAGALLGASVICNVPLDGVRFGFLRIAAEAQNWVMGPFSPGFKFDEYLCKGLESLPPDAHVRASGRLYVSLTRVRDMKNIVISKWDTRDDLIQTLRGSCFILGYSGMKPPLFNGERYIDGGYSNASKGLSLDGRVISVSPFCGDADICPEEDQGVGKLKFSNIPMDVSFSNAVRFYRTLMPPPPHILNEYYHFGYLDAYRYLKKQRAMLHGL
ncbi:patatin-like phospholipase domain-containing protein 2 [Macrobrachium nipponense]|uniref:patatin-like phospholipase domain-containing protein 2 n=1 Tax=Macrobrachium nipponense TaxID=159736 RepID=UPI0030C8AB0D